jgi:hypothetical protein
MSRSWRRREVAKAQAREPGARHAQHLGAGDVGLQDAAIEADHEIAGRRQQLEFVVAGLLLLVAQARGADAAVELLAGRQQGRRVHVLVHLTPRSLVEPPG